MSQPNKIFELIPKVMKDIGHIGKNGVNEHDRYKFRSIDDVYNKLQPALTKNGVFFVPNVIASSEEKGQTSTGKGQVRVKLKVEYTIYAEDGSSIKTTVEGEAVDRSDKATNKALTAAFKYMVIQVFCIAIEGMDDADKESHELESSESKEQKPPEHKKFAPPSKDYVVKDGKFKGKKVSEISPTELEAYVNKISSQLSNSGKTVPAWFQELKEAVA